MNKYSEYAIEAERRVSAVEAADFYGLGLSNRNFVKCPFHNEKTASFYAKGSFFYCYGCGWHGNVVDFVKDYFGLSFIAALNRVNNDFRLGLPLGRKPTFAEQRRINKAIEALNLSRAVNAARRKAEQALWDEWAGLDVDRIRFKPVGPAEPINEKYANAVKRIDYIGYLIDQYKVGDMIGTE